MEVDDSGEDNKGGDQVHDIWEVLSIKSLLERTLLVWPCQKEVEERNDGALELWTTTGVDGGWRECLPDNGLANVGGNEKRDTTSKTVSLLEKLIEEDNNQASNNQLEDKEEDHTSAKIRWLTVKTSEHVDGSLSHGQNDGEKLLGRLVELAIRFQVEVDIDQMCASQELKDHSGRNNWRNTQFHQSTSVTRHHHSEPV